jgi:hypothetical protein
MVLNKGDNSITLDTRNCCASQAWIVIENQGWLTVILESVGLGY